MRTGGLAELAARISENPVKGEVVVLVDRGAAPANEISTDDLLRQALTHMSLKDAASHVAEATGQKKRDIYQKALKLSAED